MLRNRIGKWGLALCVLGLPLACTDDTYDLGLLDTEGIRLGDNVSGTLGNRSFTLSELLSDTTKLKTDAEGNYFISFDQQMVVEVPVAKVEGKKYPDIFDKKVGQGWPSSTSPGIEVQLSQDSDPITLQLSDDVKALDSIILRTATLKVDFTVSNLEVKDDKTLLTIQIDLPTGYVLTDGSTTKDSTFIVQKLDNEGTGKKKGSLSLPLKSITPGDNDVIRSTFTFESPQGAKASSQTGPGFHADAALEDIDYEVIYGQFTSQIDIEPISIELDELSDLFEDDDAKLSFADPHIKLIGTQNSGIPIVATLRMDDGKMSTTIDSIRLEAPPIYTLEGERTSRIWIGNDPDAAEEGFIFFKNEDLANILTVVPTTPKTLNIFGEAATDTVSSFFRNPAQDPILDFTVEVPLEPTTDFRVSMSQTLEDVFDADLVDMLFSNGDVTLSGDIINELPLDMSLKLDIVDAKGKSIGINWEGQDVEALGKSTVEFRIEEKDMSKLKNKNAADIKLTFTATGSKNAKGVCLNEKQKIELKLKFKKTGGIVLSDL